MRVDTRAEREELAAHGNAVLKALVLSAEGTAYLRGGDLDVACAVLADAVRSAAAGDCEDLRLRCVATLALAEACRGHLSRGQGLADTAERLAGESVRRGGASRRNTSGARLGGARTSGARPGPALPRPRSPAPRDAGRQPAELGVRAVARTADAGPGRPGRCPVCAEELGTAGRLAARVRRGRGSGSRSGPGRAATT